MVTGVCSDSTYNNGWFHPCRNKAKMTHEGKGYCGIHDPVKKAAKRAERDAKWQAEWDAKLARSAVVEAHQKAAEHALKHHAALVAMLERLLDGAERTDGTWFTVSGTDVNAARALLDEVKS